MDMFSFSGRANRMDFWVVSIGLTLLQMVFTLLAGLMIGMLALSWLPPDQKAIAATGFGLIVHLLFLWPITAVAVRRSHDRNLSGWWYGAYALFGLGVGIADLTLEALGMQQDETAMLALGVLGLAQLAMMLLVLVVLGFLPGAQGANRFGLPPNSRHENYRAPAID